MVDKKKQEVLGMRDAAVAKKLWELWQKIVASSCQGMEPLQAQGTFYWRGGAGGGEP
jgi:hypothetical protein